MEVVPLGPGFAAELRGIDLIDVVSSDAAYRAVREAFEEHTVIVFRNQKATDDVQLGFSRALGHSNARKWACFLLAPSTFA